MLVLALSRCLLGKPAPAAAAAAGSDLGTEAPDSRPVDDPAWRTVASPRSLFAEHALLSSQLPQLRIRLTALYAGRSMPRDLHGRTPLSRLDDIESELVAIGARLDGLAAPAADDPATRSERAALADAMTRQRFAIERMFAGTERRAARSRT